MTSEHELLQFFKFEHLPAGLREVSEPFCVLARRLAAIDERQFAELAPGLIRIRAALWEREPLANVEATWAGTKLLEAWDRASDVVISTPRRLDAVLRFVLEAKDCAVRAVLYKSPVVAGGDL